MSINDILSLILIFLVFVIIVLCVIYYIMVVKEKTEKESEKKPKDNNKSLTTKSYKEYTTNNISDFMQFEGIEDNMIVQKKNQKYLMAIECQGVNYYLMSELEQNSVEIGFMKVLNTLKTPIQLYIQTRTISLGKSLEGYKERLKMYQNELEEKQFRYKKMEENKDTAEIELSKQKLEIARQRNLCAYCNDIIMNTERMNLNKNILKKKYYIILQYYANPVDFEDHINEVREVAFSDLYTRCQSLIKVLYSAGVTGKILNSEELVDLLYNAYNRDEFEVYGTDKAREAEFDALYTTSPDVLKKKLNALDSIIEQKATDLAEESIEFADKKLQKEIKNREQNLDEMIAEFAKDLISNNEEFLGEEIVELAKENIDKKTKTKGGKTNEKKANTRTRKK